MGNDTTRRDFLSTSLAVGAALAVPTTASANYAPPVASELDELTIAHIQSGMKSGKYTARSLTQKYLQRIADLDKRGPAVNAVIELNPDALAIADALDKEYRAKGPRGPMHGVPLLIKDNIN